MFCRGHHTQASGIPCAFTIGSNAQHEVYHSNIGKVQYTKAGKDTVVANLIQGDMVKFQQVPELQQERTQATVSYD